MYPAANALLLNRISPEVFKDEEILLYQPKLDGIWLKLNPKTWEGYTKDEKKYDFKKILQFHNNKMVPVCYHINCIRYLVGELCFIDPITKQITRNRHFVMDALREHKGWENYAPYIVLVVFDVILEPDYVKMHKKYQPNNSTIPNDWTTIGNLPNNSKSQPETYDEVFKFFVQDNIQLLKNDFFRCMETIETKYGRASEVEDYFMKKFEDLEGFFIRRKNSIHPSYFGNRFRRIHPDWFKVKPVYEATLKCVAIKPHSKDPSLIGALILESSDKLLKVVFGSGLTKEERHKQPEDFIGKLIEIEYEGIIPKSRLLLHVRKVGIREDVNEADSWEKLINRIK